MDRPKKGKIGIMCDTYKLKRYKRILEKFGFTDYDVTDGGSFKVISINTDMSKQPKINKVCKIVEGYFKAKRN